MVISMKSALVLCILGAVTVFAHDLIQPEWRGQDGTTYQEWTFDDDDNPAAPELINNPYGSATATITIGDFGEGWLYDLGFGEQTGIWDLGSEGTILIEIDNTSSPSEHKEIWVQVTYFTAFWPAPNVNVPGAQCISRETLLVEDTGAGSGWYLEQSKWRFEPTPNREEIIITADWDGSQIDQVVVDTKLAPPGCIVDFDDLGKFCEQWLQTGPDLNADLDNSGHVDFKDFSILANSWLDVCPPDWPFE